MSRWNPLPTDDDLASLVRPLAVVAVAVLVAVGLATVAAPGTLAASFTASDVSISTNDGQISAVTVQPDFDASWSNLDAGVHNLGYQIEVSDDGSNWETLAVATIDCSNPNADFSCGATSGSQAVYQGNVQYDLLADGDYQSGTSPFSASDFSASEGTSETTTVHLRITISVDDDSGNLVEETTVTRTFEVTVTNTDGTISISGVMGTGVSA